MVESLGSKNKKKEGSHRSEHGLRRERAENSHDEDTPRQEHADRPERKVDRCRVFKTMLTLTWLCSKKFGEAIGQAGERLLDQRTKRHCTWQMQRMRQNLRSPLLPVCVRTRAATTISNESSSKPGLSKFRAVRPGWEGGWLSKAPASWWAWIASGLLAPRHVQR